MKGTINETCVNGVKSVLFISSRSDEQTHCLDRTPDCTFWTRIVASMMADRKQASGKCQLFIIYKCYSELFTSIDRTCERNIDFLN